jgi:LssY C-terminus
VTLRLGGYLLKASFQDDCNGCRNILTSPSGLAHADPYLLRSPFSTGKKILRLLVLFLRRTLIFGLGAFSVWLIVFVIFEDADRRLPWILALSVTYGLAAYVILPRVVRMSVKILQRRLVPSYTITGDGLPGDPVNIVLVGTLPQLQEAFARADWCTADKLGLISSWRMVRAFVFNLPYPNAPFSPLYLFGRGHDIGFQRPINNSPRKRDHIRFWALTLNRSEDDVATAAFWLNTDRPPADDRVLWVGAGTRDTGFSLTRLTFQITHATDSDTNAERNYILDELRRRGVIGEVVLHQCGERLAAKHVNHYVTDGEIAFATLLDIK